MKQVFAVGAFIAFYILLIAGASYLDSQAKAKEKQAVQDQINELKSQVKHLSGALDYKVNKVESEWYTDDDTERYLSFVGWQYEYDFARIYQYVYEKLGYAIFTGKGGIYSRYLEDNEVALIPVQVFDNKPGEEVICSIALEGESRYFQKKSDQVTIGRLENCHEDKTRKKRPALKAAVNRAIKMFSNNLLK